MAFQGKILLVDDEAHIRKLLGLILRSLGATQVIEATNGQEGVALFEQEKPDLVLLDVNMPVMDGLQALEKIMAIDADAVVVMLTSIATRSAIEQALTLGVANYIRKDTPKEEIAAALTETIKDCFGDPEAAPGA